ncbi:MAG: hypothetical protein DRP25_07245 [Thermotoga sp.]|nr:MAG: hypothetical protein DRP25_07245 [Thermotoga sp.]
MSEKATFPKALKKSLENMLHGKNPERNFIINLLRKLDEWLECSCEAVYHYLLRYYLDEYYNYHYKGDERYIVGDEYLIGEILNKREKVDIVVGPEIEPKGNDDRKRNHKKQIDVREVVEIKVGKLKDLNKFIKGNRKSDFRHYRNDICKLIRIKEKKKDVHCFLLKITHGLGEAGENEKNIGKYLEEMLNGCLHSLSESRNDQSGNKQQDRCKREEYGKYQLKLLSDGYFSSICMYHLFEVKKKEE